MVKEETVRVAKYEVGVLLFNLSGVSDHSTLITNSFDVVGCLTTLARAVGVEGIEDREVQTGFFAECDNYKIPQEESDALYDKAFKLLQI